jgi:hypothetical protein
MVEFRIKLKSGQKRTTGAVALLFNLFTPGE